MCLSLGCVCAALGGSDVRPGGHSGRARPKPDESTDSGANTPTGTDQRGGGCWRGGCVAGIGVALGCMSLTPLQLQCGRRLMRPARASGHASGPTYEYRRSFARLLARTRRGRCVAVSRLWCRLPLALVLPLVARAESRTKGKETKRKERKGRERRRTPKTGERRRTKGEDGATPATDEGGPATSTSLVGWPSSVAALPTSGEPLFRLVDCPPRSDATDHAGHHRRASSRIVFPW